MNVLNIDQSKDDDKKSIKTITTNLNLNISTVQIIQIKEIYEINKYSKLNFLFFNKCEIFREKFDLETSRDYVFLANTLLKYYCVSITSKL